MAQCSAHKKNGDQCTRHAMTGLSVCQMHGGSSPRNRQVHYRALALSQWKLGDATDDPTETLLRQITQTRQRCDYYAELLYRQQDEAQDNQAPSTVDSDDDGDVAINRGPRIPKWLAGMIGFKYAAAGKDGYIYASEEGIRAMVELEFRERKLLTDQCKAAIAAGLSERVVALAEQQGAMLVQAIKLMVASALDAGMPEQWADIIYDSAPGALREIELLQADTVT